MSAETKTSPEDESTSISQDPVEEDENLSDIDSHAGSERDAMSEAGSETPSISDKSSARNSRSTSNTPTNTRSTRSRDNPEFVAKQKSFMAKIQAATSGVDSPMARPDTPGKRKRDSSASSTQSSSKKRKSGKVDNNGQDYQNDNYCWECHREGVFICCEMCPRVFHLKCAGMEKEPEEDWACSECHAVMQAENIENRSRAMQLISVEQLCTLLKFALNRLKTMPGMEPFTKPVDTTEFPTYEDVVVHPVDFTSLERNIKRKFYGSTEAFSSDARWIVHNSVIFNGANSKVTSMARSLVKILKQDMSEIETCPDCYMNAHQKPNSWFTEACRSAHPLIWARLKGFPFWPAKAVKWKDGNVDVRFFGRHDRSWVPIKECFLFSEQMPTPLKNRNKTLESCLQEVNDHITKLRERFGKFKYAPHRVQFNPLDQDQIKIMLPNYKGPVPLRVRAQSRALSRLSGQSDDETSSVASTDSGASTRRRKRESGTSSATQETETEAEFPSQSSVQDDDERADDTPFVKSEEIEDHSYSKPKDQEGKGEVKLEVKTEHLSKPDCSDLKEDSDDEMECEGYPTGNYDEEEDAYSLINGRPLTVEKVPQISKKPKLIRTRPVLNDGESKSEKTESELEEKKENEQMKEAESPKGLKDEEDGDDDEEEDEEDNHNHDDDNDEEEEVTMPADDDDDEEEEDEELGRLQLSTTEGEDAQDEDDKEEEEEDQTMKGNESESEEKEEENILKLCLKDGLLSSETKLKKDEGELEKEKRVSESDVAIARNKEDISRSSSSSSSNSSSSHCDKTLQGDDKFLPNKPTVHEREEESGPKSVEVSDKEKSSKDSRSDSEMCEKDAKRGVEISSSDRDLQTRTLVEKVTGYPGIVIKRIVDTSNSKSLIEASDRCTLSKLGDNSFSQKVESKGSSELEVKSSDQPEIKDKNTDSLSERSSVSNEKYRGGVDAEGKKLMELETDSLKNINEPSETTDRDAGRAGDKSNDPEELSGHDESDDESRLQIDKDDSDDGDCDKERENVSRNITQSESNKDESGKGKCLDGRESEKAAASETESGSNSNENELERIKREFASKMGISITVRDSDKKSSAQSKQSEERMDVDEASLSKKDNEDRESESMETESESKSALEKTKESVKQQEEDPSRNSLFDAVQLMKNMGTIAITKLDKSSELESRLESSISLSLAKGQTKSDSSDSKKDESDHSVKNEESESHITKSSSGNKNMEQQISALGCSVSVTKALDKDRDKEKEKEKDREKEKDKEKEKVKMPSGVDTTRLSPSISIIAVTGVTERHRAKTTIAPSASPNPNRNSPTPSGHNAPRSSPSVNAQNHPENSSSSGQPNNPPRVSSASSSNSPHTGNTGGIPPPPPLSHPQSSPSNSASSRGVFVPPSATNQVLGIANNRAPIITSPGLRMMSAPGPGPGMMFPNRLPGMPPTRHLPPEAGPLATQLHKHSQKLAEVMRATLEDVLGGLVGTGTPEARLAALQLELERTSWRHQQELAEVRHNADVMLVEMRANLEAEKQRAVEEVKRQMEQQHVEVRRQMERQMVERLAEVKRQMEAERQRAVEETKKKQWCANCGKEALFFCCWNTSYCDYPCQQSHWPQHMSVCGQNSDSGGGGGGEGGSDSVNGEASAQSSRVSTPVQSLVAAQLADEEGAVALAEELRRRKHREDDVGSLTSSILAQCLIKGNRARPRKKAKSSSKSGSSKEKASGRSSPETLKSPKAWMEWFLEQSEGIKENLNVTTKKSKSKSHKPSCKVPEGSRKKRKSTPCIRRKIEHILTPEEVTSDMLDKVAVRSKDKQHDQENGTSCHQCRQKTGDTKTICRSGRCVGLRGFFCGPCLSTRYGEDAKKALLDPTWACPVCRGICNCSLCRKAFGQQAVGQIVQRLGKMGYSSVQQYLESKTEGDSQEDAPKTGTYKYSDDEGMDYEENRLQILKEEELEEDDKLELEEDEKLDSGDESEEELLQAMSTL
ncbi:MYND-type zinc finger-containing chromatin reader ZMYND8 isoform X2 [Macrobrachium rosenbergii]|uniref:MYND-type zinc finger-containing chromatin reader ZMYND8 isoform X2 n=1 Tax=Macrobrachium rosenbergii TaxID=79674 RepID=UPI0034D68D15